MLSSNKLTNYYFLFPAFLEKSNYFSSKLPLFLLFLLYVTVWLWLKHLLSTSHKLQLCWFTCVHQACRFYFYASGFISVAKLYWVAVILFLIVRFHCAQVDYLCVSSSNLAIEKGSYCNFYVKLWSSLVQHFISTLVNWGLIVNYYFLFISFFFFPFQGLT